MDPGIRAIKRTPLVARPTLLLVDDASELNRIYRALLEPSGYDVRTTDSAADALQMLGEGFRPDLMLVDYRMPGMDGMQLIATVQQRFPDVVPARIVLLTGFDSRAPQFEPLRQSGVRVVEKPDGIDTFVPLLKGLMAGVLRERAH